jgi:two-component system OmpR family sensor kinase
MKLAGSLGGTLTIFGRTFALTVAALFVAEAVGIALLVTRPPLHNAPVRLSEIARELSGSRPGGGPPPGAFEPGQKPPGADRGPPPGGFGGPPPPGPARRGPGDETRREWQLRDAIVAPLSPRGADLKASERMRELLAARLGVSRERVRVYVTEDNPRNGPFGFEEDPQLREGFVAAWQRDSGAWRVMESVVEDFPNAFQRQALWLFALGLVVLLPVSWLFARALAAPIRRFAEGARRLGIDPHAPALERAGPPEMQAAIDSFNAMQGRLNRLLQERSHMIGAIAHDLRTPLMRLAFRLDGLEQPLKDKVEADINEMKLMISAALDFLRDQAARGTRQPLDLRLLVESVVDDQSDVGHDVTLLGGESAAGSIIILGDPLSLRRLVVNLVDNALKYGERARLRLQLRGSTCAIEIDDDGPGIPDPLQQRVFEPFFRTEASRNRDTGGIGLGLTTARAIALDHGGDIELRNRKEGGLRVIVSLPLTGQ